MTPSSSFRFLMMAAGADLFDLHVSENDRGIPWPEAMAGGA